MGGNQTLKIIECNLDPVLGHFRHHRPQVSILVISGDLHPMAQPYFADFRG